MIYNEYGNTGVELSVIGFGGMRFRDQENVEECASLVKYAYDSGINYFDTAPGYGKSEALFGEAFKEMKKTRAEKSFYVSTKSMKSDPSALRRDLENSLNCMGLDYVDFYHLWCVMSMNAYERRKAQGILREFEKMKDEGLIRHICVSSHMTGENIANMLRDYPFAGVLLGYSVMNFSYRQLGIDAAAKLNMGVAVMNPLGGGVVPRHSDRFDFITTQSGESVVEGALRFLIGDPRITLALVGFSAAQEVDEAVKAVEGFKPVSYSDYERIRNQQISSFNQLCTLCRYCDICPQGIPIPQVMDSYNSIVLNEGTAKLVERMHMHWGFEPGKDPYPECTGCGACEKACTQKLPVMQRIEEVRQAMKDVK